MNDINIMDDITLTRRPRGASGYALASHRWGPEFASRSLHVDFVVDETGLGRFFTGFLPFSPTTNFIPPLLHTHLIHFVFISSALMMVRHAWSAGTLAIVALT